ncbi:uncharacterized protein F4822DRAFT_421814 [Hypoxylon trugodes]|uniref:uncharacterized protein n=1 Tax=Hypoxylon trugodes TaxID=326681 RepID=UPI00218DB011|nr:uncharacterized protein F4822DRAFT_421814 [Hypoxylon trugodes]KAI1383005.1 hypothetical protein F4822DRAFT_421814 [Hypoxylon trugodes]
MPSRIENTCDTQFPIKRLPAELRLRIWEQALVNESAGRVVILDERNNTIYPFKSLASPLLSVNVESRSCALEFYGTKLNVWVNGYPDDESERPIGSLYLNSRYDIFTANFFVTYDFDLERCSCYQRSMDEEEIEPVNYSVDFGTQEFPMFYATCSEDFCSCVERVLSIERAYPIPPYDDSIAHLLKESYWPERVFPAIQEYFYDEGYLTKRYNPLAYLSQRQPGELLVDKLAFTMSKLGEGRTTPPSS